MTAPFEVNDFNLTPHFNLRQFEDPTTHQVMLDPGLLFRLEVVTLFHGKQFIISSGYRSIAHNLAVGGLSNSYHLSGKAVDIPGTGDDLVDLAAAASTAGFRKDQIIIEVDHIHLEVD
jgi:uncharacterized protein YcbK (DUF882 family)